jgi:hypothetical protein
MKTHSIYILFIAALLFGCDTSKFEKIPIEDFAGTWELQGRSMFNGIVVKIEKNDSGKLTGRLVRLNDNKYVQMFCETGDLWVTEISRSSNYQFKLTEKKIGSQLFALYDLRTSDEFDVEFIDKNTIGLALLNKEPTKSIVVYKRIQE